jgi:hypothetical protein
MQDLQAQYAEPVAWTCSLKNLKPSSDTVEQGLWWIQRAHIAHWMDASVLVKPLLQAKQVSFCLLLDIFSLALHRLFGIVRVG